MFHLLAATTCVTAMNWGVFEHRPTAILFLSITAVFSFLSIGSHHTLTKRLGTLWALAMLAQVVIPGYFHTPVGTHKKLITIVLALSAGALSLRHVRWVWPVIFAGFFAIAWTYIRLPPPQFDLWYLQENAIALMGNGLSPYALEYYAGVPLVDTWVKGLPYPPAHTLILWLGQLTSDFRWTFVVSLSIGALSIQTVLPRGSLPWTSAIAITFLFHPKGLLYVWRGWTEPTLIGALGVAAFALSRGHRRLMIFSLGVVLTVKQFGFIFLTSLISTRNLSMSTSLKACVVAIAIVLPFLVTDPMGLITGVITSHLNTPPRPDSWSIPALITLWGGPQLGGLTPFIALAVASSLVFLRMKRAQTTDLSDAAAAAAACYLAFFLMSPKAHENYYFTPLFLTLLSFAASVKTSLGGLPRPGALL